VLLEHSFRLEKTEMPKLKKKSSILESIPLLVLLGIVAGAVGGLGIGLIQLHSMSAAASASATGK
jgi:hypothetical protein